MPHYAGFDGLNDFAEFYHEEIVPALHDGSDVNVDPDRETPTYRWLKSNCSGFVERLRRDHDLSPGEFYDTVGLPPNADESTDDPCGALIMNRPSGRSKTTSKSLNVIADARKPQSVPGVRA